MGCRKVARRKFRASVSKISCLSLYADSLEETYSEPKLPQLLHHEVTARWKLAHASIHGILELADTMFRCLKKRSKTIKGLAKNVDQNLTTKIPLATSDTMRLGQKFRFASKPAYREQRAHPSY